MTEQLGICEGISRGPTPHEEASLDFHFRTNFGFGRKEKNKSKFEKLKVEIIEFIIEERSGVC